MNYCFQYILCLLDQVDIRLRTHVTDPEYFPGQFMELFTIERADAHRIQQSSVSVVSESEFTHKVGDL